MPSSTAGTPLRSPLPPPHVPLPPIPTDSPPLGDLAVALAKTGDEQEQTQASDLNEKTTQNHTSSTTSTYVSSPRKPGAQSPEQFVRAIRDRSREQYHRLRDRPSVTELSTHSRANSTKSAPAGPRYPTPASLKPCISTFSAKGRSLHSVPSSPAMPTIPFTRGGSDGGAACFPGKGFDGLTIRPGNGSVKARLARDLETGCIPQQPPGARYMAEIKHKVKALFHGFHVSVTISVTRQNHDSSDNSLNSQRLPQRSEMTLRVKNSKQGNCIFEIIRAPNTSETIMPVLDLKTLFPHSKPLQKALIEWNAHYQNPPPHWVLNFIPRAYLRRGYFLAEEVCEYFLSHPDGCRYRVEYEPIGHEWCHVGTIVPRPKRVRKNFSMQWEGKEKY